MTKSDLSLTGFVQQAQRKHASSTYQDFCSWSLDFTMSASLLTGTGEDWTSSWASVLFLGRLHLWDKYSCFHFLKNRVATPTQLRSPQSASSYWGRPPTINTDRIPHRLLGSWPCFWEGAIWAEAPVWWPPGFLVLPQPPARDPSSITPGRMSCLLFSSHQLPGVHVWVQVLPFSKDISHTDLWSTKRPHSSLDNLCKDPTKVL